MVSMNLRRPKSIFNFSLSLGGVSSKSVTEDLREDDIIIATLGSIGTGKSNFIDHLVNGKTADSTYSPLASPSLVSPSTALKGREIKPVRIYDHHTYGNRLVLLDTPGYDDINFVEADVLRMIKTFLKKSSGSDSVLLSGIISFHRISDNRSPERQQNLNVGLFSGLCAGGGLKRVIFMTTMWDKANGDEKKREMFEKRMMGYQSHWASLIQAGATQKQFNNTPETAWGVISSLLAGSERTSLRDLFPFPSANSPDTPRDSNTRGDASDSPSTDNSWTTLSTPTSSRTSSKAAALKTDASVELPLFSPISPISATMDRAFPVVSISEEASSSPVSPAPAVPLHKLPNDVFSQLPGSTRPRLTVDLPRQIIRQTSRASGDCYAPTPCPLSPNTSDMWLLADRVYIAGSLSERMAFA